MKEKAKYDQGCIKRAASSAFYCAGQLQHTKYFPHWQTFETDVFKTVDKTHQTAEH